MQYNDAASGTLRGADACGSTGNADEHGREREHAATREGRALRFAENGRLRAASGATHGRHGGSGIAGPERRAHPGRCRVRERQAAEQRGRSTAHAQQAHDGNPDVRAVIRADKDVAWGSVVHVLDLLKQGSVAKIAFGVSR